MTISTVRVNLAVHFRQDVNTLSLMEHLLKYPATVDLTLTRSARPPEFLPLACSYCVRHETVSTIPLVGSHYGVPTHIFLAEACPFSAVRILL